MRNTFFDTTEYLKRIEGILRVRVIKQAKISQTRSLGDF